MTKYEYFIRKRDNARLQEQAARDVDFYATAILWRDLGDFYAGRANALTLEEAGEPATGENYE
ncbi:MAG: hypothetical protein LBS86_00815 [Treponema sp.]|jgi:hypothetical protein|nr:hypothetical protein [Treponema sp.]